MNLNIRARLVELAKTEDLTWRYWGDKKMPRIWSSATDWRALSVAERRELDTLLADQVLVSHKTIGRGYYTYNRGA